MSDKADPGEPRWITETMLWMIHAQQVERYGGAHGILDENVVRSALARPLHRQTYDPEADIADLVAAYMVGFARSQGFNDGNKRTGLAVALVFLRRNGYAIHVPGKELYALTVQVANQEAEVEIVAAYLRSRMEAR